MNIFLLSLNLLFIFFERNMEEIEIDKMNDEMRKRFRNKNPIHLPSIICHLLIGFESRRNIVFLFNSPLMDTDEKTIFAKIRIIEDRRNE